MRSEILAKLITVDILLEMLERSAPLAPSELTNAIKFRLEINYGISQLNLVPNLTLLILAQLSNNQLIRNTLNPKTHVLEVTLTQDGTNLATMLKDLQISDVT